MDSGLTIRPSDGAVQAAIVRPSATPVPQAVVTDLAPSRAVTAADSIVGTRNDSRPVPTQQPATRVDISFDKKTHTAVYRIIDTGTGKVILQVPQQAQTDISV